jgi:hypothetical protein
MKTLALSSIYLEFFNYVKFTSMQSAVDMQNRMTAGKQIRGSRVPFYQDVYTHSGNMGTFSQSHNCISELSFINPL